MDSISDIPAPARLLKDFTIPVIALVDEDPGNKDTERVRKKIVDILGKDNVFIQSPNLEGLFGLTKKPSRVDALEYFPKWFETHKVSDIPAVYKDVAAYLEK
jgi:hypothetical protein